MTHIVGLAGHVDHGKSTLVAALTGMRPDRLAEEQRRAMTIDLGFTWLTLPSGAVASLIDVPGHERFIKNMLAGVGGIDAALLVIAADEGIMPQTVEHLHILELLGITSGLVVLTKTDAIDDEWLALMVEEVGRHLTATSWQANAIIPVSARTGAGIGALTAALDALLAALPPRPPVAGPPRLPVDRAFTVGGFGTVVTGTLLDAPLAVGQEIELLPAGLRGRIRGLQTRHASAETALPGARVAVNLAGISVDEVGRGALLTVPGAIRPTTLIDLQLQLVADAPPLEHNTALELFVGAAAVPCSAALLDRELLAPGEAGWVQLRLAQPVAVVRGDRCVLRIPSPSQTVGGGAVVDPHPQRHRRHRPEVLAALATLARGTPAELVAQALGAAPQPWAAVLAASGLDPAAAAAALNELALHGQAILLDPPLTAASTVLSAAAWERLATALVAAVAAHHQAYPLRPGLPREALRQRLGLATPRLLALVLQRAAAAGHIAAAEGAVRLAGWTPQLTAAQRQTVGTLLATFAQQPFQPPARADWEAVGLEIISYLIERGDLVRVSPDVLFSAAAYTKLVEWTQQTLVSDGQITVAQLRDTFSTSRKYALAFLEHLDERKITRRVGEHRTSY